RAAAMPMGGPGMTGLAAPAGAAPRAAMAAFSGLPPTPAGRSLQSRAKDVAARIGVSRRPSRSASGRSTFPDVESPALRAVAEEYLPRLHDVRGDERPALLREIRERLERLLPELVRSGADPLVVRPVEQVVADLVAYERRESPGAGETERLRLRVVDVLQAFAPAAAPETSEEPAPGASGTSSSGTASAGGTASGDRSERTEPRRRRFWTR